MPQRLLVIGGVAAGMSAAAKARRVNPDLEIIVYTDDEYISYAGCGLPYFIGGRIAEKESLIAKTVARFASENTIVKTKVKAEEIKPPSKKIILKDLNNDQIFEDHYDRLVIASGARPFVPPMNGIDMEGVFTLRTINDGLRIKNYLQKRQPRKAAIIGGGYIGLEMAENLLEHGCEVSIIERAPHIIPNMDEDMAMIVKTYLKSKGIQIYTSTAVSSFSGDGTVTGVNTDRGTMDTDFVMLSIGVQPNSEIASAAGIEVGIRDAIRVNSKMETNIDGIYAAGDCATTTHLVSGQEVYIPMGTTANKQGKTAGENAAGGNATFNGVLGTGIARVMEMEISRTGLSERECSQLGIHYTAKKIEAESAAYYCPTSGKIYIKLIADRATNRLVGAQIAGYQGSAMRIDMLAAALTMQATIEDLINMDLAYSPPFSPVWDPVLIALNQF